MTKVSSRQKKYDLEERTTNFGKNIILFCTKLPRNPITVPLITQLVKAATSIGANYCEADDAVSKNDFRNKIGFCKKESRETRYFLTMISAAIPDIKEEAEKYKLEAKEINLIFNAIFHKVK